MTPPTPTAADPVHLRELRLQALSATYRAIIYEATCGRLDPPALPVAEDRAMMLTALDAAVRLPADRDEDDLTEHVALVWDEAYPDADGMDLDSLLLVKAAVFLVTVGSNHNEELMMQDAAREYLTARMHGGNGDDELATLSGLGLGRWLSHLPAQTPEALAEMVYEYVTAQLGGGLPWDDATAHAHRTFCTAAVAAFEALGDYVAGTPQRGASA